MFIEAVTICNQYSDFLSWHLLFNKKHFDNYVVVTTHDDVETHKVCEFYGVRCVHTNVMDDAFNKGKAINVGLSQLSRKGFIAHIDSDILLPPRTREMLEYAKLQPEGLYGILRMNVVGFDNWANFVASPKLQHEMEIYVHADAFPMSPIISKTWDDIPFAFDKGYVPIGYFQLWGEHDGQRRVYSEEHDSCARSDMLFGLQWPREKRQLVPEVIAYHLMTEDLDVQGKNWAGRKTKRFGPC